MILAVDAAYREIRWALIHNGVAIKHGISIISQGEVSRFEMSPIENAYRVAMEVSRAVNPEDVTTIVVNEAELFKYYFEDVTVKRIEGRVVAEVMLRNLFECAELYRVQDHLWKEFYRISTEGTGSNPNKAMQRFASRLTGVSLTVQRSRPICLGCWFELNKNKQIEGVTKVYGAIKS